jgi:hypothetical protein
MERQKKAVIRGTTVGGEVVSKGRRTSRGRKWAISY